MQRHADLVDYDELAALGHPNVVVGPGSWDPENEVFVTTVTMNQEPYDKYERRYLGRVSSAAVGTHREALSQVVDRILEARDKP